MKKPDLTPLLIFIIGSVVFLVGTIKPGYYDYAKASGYEIEATVTEVIFKEDWDSDPITNQDTYVVYGDYTVDGKEYKHVKIGRFPQHYSVGETITAVCDPNNPEKMISEGGILCTVGFVIAGFGLISLISGAIKKIKEKKKSSNTGNIQ